MEDIRVIDYRRKPEYFLHLEDTWNLEKFPNLWTIGNCEILRLELTALFCSRKCPGRVIVRSHDFADELKVKNVPVVGGFQTPVEKMCLEILLKGSQPVVVCPARGISGMRLPAEWHVPLEEGRLLVVSPFASKQRRASAASAELRNRFVAAAAGRIVFMHAAPKSRTLSLAVELLQDGREVETLDIPENADLNAAGATLRS